MYMGPGEFWGLYGGGLGVGMGVRGTCRENLGGSEWSDFRRVGVEKGACRQPCTPPG